MSAAAPKLRAFVCAVALALLAVFLVNSRGQADTMDTSGADPWEPCAECHGLDGAGNRIKFPRLAGQKATYIIKQIEDFRTGRRQNDGGQMQKMATELSETDIPRVADWFSQQSAPWPKLTIDAEPDLARARLLALKGGNGMQACLSCHSGAELGLLDRPIVAPRLAGQRDFYIAKELTDFREGRRGNDPDQIMTKIARRLTDSDIISLAIFLTQNPGLHDEVTP